ncbi:hypothetical protein MPTK1_2g16270 [Marchantia polymorpha subsp. ruderalis]|uniref:Uncharacterized protein n=1 Tax=Marchantia polymorpha TaxID=3197 RepID=A0A2R6W9T9_MARPO|nr:hypothetical protein MARPO_0122s0037 [Marchantia polymorpha]BBN02560.1 hypothetical protein Mp_2g16270 [Marchantia polymorpha subsp. ruderalis]|eukprot:PTQ30609.1 hypothetical protein MARPO_0122s0037 [Marchantia polymorpha]
MNGIQALPRRPGRWSEVARNVHLSVAFAMKFANSILDRWHIPSLESMRSGATDRPSSSDLALPCRERFGDPRSPAERDSDYGAKNFEPRW